MRLVNTDSLSLEEFDHNKLPSYAILSHRWEDGEVTLQDWVHDNRDKRGFLKILGCCQVAANNGHKYVWIDTCCIDKSSSAELSEVINSMYAWYQSATACYVYLSDVHTIQDLRTSVWFTRGWTLQELIAPADVTFFDKCWQKIGTKLGMQKTISEITGIPVRVLRCGSHASSYSVAQRFSWASHRKTQRAEDQAYSLLGLFGVNMPVVYGEGMKAFMRLQEEIIKGSGDHSLFAWKSDQSGPRGILATSPSCFRYTNNYTSISTVKGPEPYFMTNVGLSITLKLKPWAMNIYLALLDCHDKTDEDLLMPVARVEAEKTCVGIFLQQTSNDRQFVRTSVENQESRIFHLDREENEFTTLQVLLLNKELPTDDCKRLYGYVFRHISWTAFPSSSPFWYSTLDIAEMRKYRMRQLEEHADCSLAQIYESPSRFDRWRTQGYMSACGEHSIPLLVSNLCAGESGTAFELTMTNMPDNFIFTPAGQPSSYSPIYKMKFGFDFQFNPICMFWNYESQSSDSAFPDTHDDSWISAIDKLPNLALDVIWKDQGVCVVRFDRKLGGTLALPFLGLELSMMYGHIYGTTKAWIVDMRALEPPLNFTLANGR